MAIVHPFKAIRPTRDKVHLVVSRPFYTYKKNVLKAKLETNPYSFMHIINPEFNKKHQSEPNSIERFKAVKEKYTEFVDKKYLIEDEVPSMYLYRQTHEGNTFTGLIACASVDDYLNDVIKKHEQTLTSRVKVFSDYLDVVKFNAEPVLLSYPKEDQIVDIYSEIIRQRAEYEFTTTDEIKHELWLIQDNKKIEKLKHLFSKVASLYIADGHHRSSSSALHAERMRKKGVSKEQSDAFLAYIIDDEQLKIWEFNRLVTDLGKHDVPTFLKALEKEFDIAPIKNAQKPTQKYQVTLYLDKKWYLLNLKENFRSFSDVQSAIDTQMLTDHILSPILGIEDLKTDQRIDFMSGTEGILKLKKAVDSGKFQAGFVLYPVSFEEIKSISDAGATMPPKSTWIEPKLRSGMTILKV